MNLVTRVAERLTSPRPSVLQSPTAPTVPAGPTLDPDGPDGDADDELKEVGIMSVFFSCVELGKRREKEDVIVAFSHGSLAVGLGGGGCKIQD